MSWLISHYSQWVSTPPAAQIPAEQLPLVFHAAPGWPTPTLEWVTTHQGWQPPPGWVPMTGCPHSPPRWQFWSRNGSAWSRMARPHLRSARRNVWAGNVLILLAVGGTVLGLVGGADAVRLIVATAFLIGVGILVRRARAQLRQIDADLFRAVADDAAHLKLQLDRAHYARYLRSSSGT